MTSGTYGTLQGDASPSPRRSYRLSKVAKIALALIACGGAAVLAHPVTRKAAASFAMDTYSGLTHNIITGTERSGGAARPVPVKGSAPLKDKVHQLETRVTIIENYLQATTGTGSDTSRVMGTYGGVEQVQFLIRSARNPQDGKLTVAEVIEGLQDRVVNIEKYLQAAGGSGPSGNSRDRTNAAAGVYYSGAGGLGGRRLRGDQDSGGSDNSRVLDAYGGISNVYDSDGNRDGAAPVTTTTIKDQVQDLEARVAAIVKYLVAAGGSGNSRQQIHQMLQMLAASDGGGR